MKYANAWDELKAINKELWDKCGTEFVTYVEVSTALNQLNDRLAAQLEHTLSQESSFHQEDFIVNPILFKKMLLASIVDKARRINRINENGRKFTIDELEIHFETGIRSGVYLFFRTLLNQQYTRKLSLSSAKAAANWYFVREFCYGAMFRFNNKGEFNIPYGGIAYNKKNFRQKVEKIFNNQITTLFAQTTLFNLDFEEFLAALTLKSSDFIFLDPPYDSEFSEYDQSAFTQHDQERLAKFLIKTKAKWMVVIKETPFIKQIYTHAKVKMITFDKNYAYNVRGRNNRAVKHLIITNH